MTRPTDDLLDSTAPDDVERRLRSALSIKARALPVADEAFDPDRPAILTEPVPTARPASRGGRGRSPWTAVAAAAAVALTAVTWRGMGAPTASLDTSTTVVPGVTAALVDPAPTAPSPAPVGPGLVASWLPAGYELIDLQVRQDPASADPSVAVTQTLVPTSGDPGRSVLLDIQPGAGGLGSGEPLTVNGQPGITRPAKDAGDFDVSWIDGGATATATVTGLDLAQAVDLLETLRWTGDHRAMASVGALGWQLGGDVEGRANVGVTAVYRNAEDRTFTVQANTYEAGRYGYSGLKLSGTAQADGSVVVVDRFDPARPTVMVAWPDGRKVSVVGLGLDDPAMVHVASSMQARDDAELRAQRAEGSAHMARLPVLVTGAVPVGTVTVVGSSAPAGVCLTLPGHDPVCATNSFGYPDRISAGLLIDDRPYAVAATAPGSVSPGYGFVHVTGAGVWDASPIETGTDTVGGWRVLVTAPPADIHRDLGVGTVTDGQVGSSSSIPWAEL